jgi:hypothetical protein
MPENPERYKSLSRPELVALLCRRPVSLDDVDVQVLLNATLARLRVLRMRARQGNSVLEASEFARWVVASGLLKVFALEAGQGVADVQGLLSETSADCEDAWGGRKPWVGLSDLEAVNEKLERLLSMAAKPANRLPQPDIGLISDAS